MVVGALAGCQAAPTPESAARDTEACQAYGFAPGSEGMAACMFHLDQDRREQRRERWAAVGVGLQNYGNAMQHSYRAPVYTNCSSSRLGMSVQTRCSSY